MHASYLVTSASPADQMLMLVGWALYNFIAYSQHECYACCTCRVKMSGLAIGCVRLNRRILQKVHATNLLSVKMEQEFCLTLPWKYIKLIVKLELKRLGFPPKSTPPDEGMQCISVGDPTNQTRVGREGYDSISRDAEIPLSSGSVIGQHAVD